MVNGVRLTDRGREVLAGITRAETLLRDTLRDTHGGGPYAVYLAAVDLVVAWRVLLDGVPGGVEPDDDPDDDPTGPPIPPPPPDDEDDDDPENDDEGA